MLDRNGTPVSLQVLGNQSPVAVMRLVFTAKEAALVYELFDEGVFDAPSLHKVEKSFFAGGPVSSVFLILVEEFFGWCPVRVATRC